MYKRNFFLFIKIFNTHKNRLPQTSTGTMCLLVNPDLRPVGPHPDDNSGLRLPLVQDRRQKGPPTDDNSGRRLSLVPDRRRQEGSPPDDDCLGSDAPLLNPTGDPLLDARLEKEQAELASRYVVPEYICM